MGKLPELVERAWEEREGFCVFSTADSSGIPNSIYVAYAYKFNDEIFLIADIALEKTRANVLENNKGSLLFLTVDYESFQIKGSLEYQKSGEYFDKLVEWIDNEVPLEGAVILNVESIFCDGNLLIAQ